MSHSDISVPLSHLQNLPTEVWERCWSYCHNRRLRRLALVCRLFRDICHPLLFYKQIFRAPYTEDITPRNWMHFCAHIVSTSLRLQRVRDSRHVSSVRRLVFVGNFDLDLAWKYPKTMGILELNQRYLSAVHELQLALSQYRQLGVLFLSNLTINTNFRQALSGLPRLVELTLADCDITCRLGSPMGLKRLTISGVLSEETGISFPLRIVSPITLQSLCLKDGPDGDSVLSAFVRGDAFHDLVDLEICVTIEIAERFFTFLQDCPRLENIAVLSAPISLTNGLASSAIPLLGSFYGPIFLAETFICDRPVHAAGLIPPGHSKPADVIRDITSVLCGIAKNSTPLRSLGLPPISPTTVLFSTIRELFPDLRELSMDFIEPDFLPTPHNTDFLDAAIDEAEFCEQCDDDGDSDGDEEAAPYYIFTADGVSIRVPGSNGVSRNQTISTSKIGLNMEGLPQRPPTSFSDLMDWLCAGDAKLPRRLQELSLRRLDPSSPLRSTSFPPPQQHRMIIALSLLLAELRVLRFSEYKQWRFQDGVWVDGGDP